MLINVSLDFRVDGPIGAEKLKNCKHVFAIPKAYNISPLF